MKRHDYHVQFAQATRSRGEGSHSARVSRRHAGVASGISVETYARISLEHDVPVVYVCVYAIDVVHECNTPLAEEATREPGWKRCNKRDTFARLARRRIERTNWKPTRYVSPPVARVVKQSLLRRSIRTRTRLGSSRFRCLPALSSFLLSFFPLLLWVSTRGKWRREGGAGERLSRRRLSPPRSLFYFSREICRVGRKRRRNLPSRPFGWVATFRKRREKIRVFIIFIIGEHKHLRHSTMEREGGDCRIRSVARWRKIKKRFEEKRYEEDFFSFFEMNIFEIFVPFFVIRRGRISSVTDLPRRGRRSLVFFSPRYKYRRQITPRRRDAVLSEGPAIRRKHPRIILTLSISRT